MKLKYRLCAASMLAASLLAVAEAASGEVAGDFKGYLLRQALISKITQEISALSAPASAG